MSLAWLDLCLVSADVLPSTYPFIRLFRQICSFLYACSSACGRSGPSPTHGCFGGGEIICTISYGHTSRATGFPEPLWGTPDIFPPAAHDTPNRSCTPDGPAMSLHHQMIWTFATHCGHFALLMQLCLYAMSNIYIIQMTFCLVILLTTIFNCSDHTVFCVVLCPPYHSCSVPKCVSD